jgi:hypothetical protein
VLGNSTTKINLGNRCKPNFLSAPDIDTLICLDASCLRPRLLLSATVTTASSGALWAFPRAAPAPTTCAACLLRHPGQLPRPRLPYARHFDNGSASSSLATLTLAHRATALLGQPRRLPLQPQHLRRIDRYDCRGMIARLLLLQSHRLCRSRCDWGGC